LTHTAVASAMQHYDDWRPAGDTFTARRAGWGGGKMEVKR